MASSEAYIALPRPQQHRVILGAGILWFYNLLFGFAMPVILPALMEYYDMMAYYAILGGVTSLVGCIVTPIGGKLGDRFGRRRVCLIAGYLRLALMLLCAIPTSGPVFFALYSAANFVGGFINAYPATILSDVTTPAERPRWFGIFGTINGAALLIGLFGGGAVADVLGPLSIFWLVAPLGIAALVLLTLFYPNRPSGSAAGIDGGGMALLGAGFACVLSWCAFGGTLFPRVSLPGIALLAAGLVLLAFLLRYERSAQDPLLDLSLFRNHHFAMSFSTHLLIAPMMCLCSSTLSLFGQKALGLSATVSGTLALPKNILFLIVPALLGTWIARDQRRFRAAFLTCGGAIALASFLCAGWNTGTSVLTIYAVMVIFGVGTSCQSVCIQPYMQMAVPSAQLGSAASMVQFANSIGVVIFNAFYNIFYNARYAEAMAQGGGPRLAEAIAETFSCISILSAVCGLAIMALTLGLGPGRWAAAQRTAQ